MVARASEKLGVGLYTPVEAARFVRARPEAITRWIYGSAKGDRVVRSELDAADERIITFVDMIQALSIRAVRTQARQVPLHAIRQAVRTAEDQLGLSFPLARRHALYYFDSEIFLRPEGRDEVVGLTGRSVGQHLLRPIVEPFLEEIRFDEDGLADKWTPMVRDHLSIELDPKFRFGQPVVAPLGVLASVLAESAVTEGSVDAAADVHDVPREAVLLAVKYFDSLTGLAA